MTTVNFKFGNLLNRAADRFGRRPILLTLFGIWLVTVAYPLHAQELPTGVFDNVADGFKTVSRSWFDPLYNFGLRLFRLLAAIEIAWCGIIWALEKQDMSSLVGSLLKKIIGLNMFYALILYANVWIPAIINSFAIAGQTASGTSGLSPSDITTRGLDCAFRIFDAVSFLGLDLANSVVIGLTCLVLGVVIALTFGVIACQLLVALVESYFVLSAGVIFLGFGGSRWTNDFVQKYIGYAVATGVKLMMMYLIIGAADSISAGWPAMLNESAGNQAVLQTSLVVMVGSMMLAFLSWQIPALASSMLAGSPNLTAGSAATFGTTAVAGSIGTAAMGAKSVTGLASAASAGLGGGSSGLAQATAANTMGSFGGANTLGGGTLGTSSVSTQVTPPSTAGSFAAGGAPSAGASAQVQPPSIGAFSAAAKAGPAGLASHAPTAQANTPTEQGKDTGGADTTSGSAGLGHDASRPTAGLSDNAAAPAQASLTPMQPTVSDQVPPPPLGGEKSAGPGVLDRLQQVRAPHFPSDAPSGGTVQIRLDGGHD